MRRDDHLWALVLAAGDGRRLRGLTTLNGQAVPKQFCSLDFGPSLLHESLQRAERIADPQRICAIVADQHRCWWGAQLSDLPSGNVIVQPRNRGTGNGILLPLLWILERDPEARIVVLPSDHHFEDEERLARYLKAAAAPSLQSGAQILLLGFAPREADPELGYIVPRGDCLTDLCPVERFVEKPQSDQASELIAAGALWNSFILAADGHALLGLFERRCPQAITAMRSALRSAPDAGAALAALYETLPDLDFSHGILPGQESLLRVLAVPDCGWSDLGTPQRVAEAVRDLGRKSARANPARQARYPYLSLAAQHRRLGGAAEPRPGASLQ